MTTDRSEEYLKALLRELCALPAETEWVEFKHNNQDPQEIGEYISSLSNSATLCGKTNAYLVWGVNNETHDVVGTTFTSHTTKKGNEELENWLLRLLTPRIHFHFYSIQVEQKPVVILEIARAVRNPVQFQGVEYIRVGSYKKKLKEYPEKERALWRVFDEIPFEQLIALERVPDDEVLKLLDYPAYFELFELSLPDNREGILKRLESDEVVVPCEAGGWNITNLGAILFAKKLDDFKQLRRKAVRVIVYRDNSRVETIREQTGNRGYACGFEGLIG